MKDHKLRMWETNSGWYQQFRYKGGFFTNPKTGFVLDVEGGSDAEGAGVVVSQKHTQKDAGAAQQWTVIYKTEIEEKLQLEKEFGVVFNRPFYVMSLLPSGRYLDVLGDNVVLKTQNGFDS